jgi:plastocyanin
MRLNGWIVASACVAGVCSVSSAQITGKVLLQGDPPEMPEIKLIQSVGSCAELHKNPVYEDSVVVGDKNELANVIVFIKPDAGKTLTGPKLTTPAVIDQKGCMYSPHVIAVEIGQPVEVKNSDPFLHNVHALTIDNNAFNFAEPMVMSKPIEPFTAVETFQIKCDVHGWMKAVIRVFDNPYFAVSDEGGKFSLDTKGLADGTYNVVAWHEVYKESAPQAIEVKGGKIAKPVEFKFQAKSAKAEAEPMKQVHVADIALPTAGGAASAADDCCTDPKTTAVAKKK